MRINLTEIDPATVASNSFLTNMDCDKGCQIIMEQFTDSSSFCQKFLPDSAGSSDVPLVTITGQRKDRECIDPSNALANYELFHTKLTGDRNAEFGYPGKYTTFYHSCTESLINYSIS